MKSGWRLLLETSVNYLDEVIGEGPHHHGSFSRRAAEAIKGVIPYCLHPLENSDQYIILNRFYKPLGLYIESEWVDYKDFPFHFIPFDVIESWNPEWSGSNSLLPISRLTKVSPTKMSGPGFETAYYFFSDGTSFYGEKRDAVRLRDEIVAILGASRR